jgi:diacylglycerol kinase (ATP)
MVEQLELDAEVVGTSSAEEMWNTIERLKDEGVRTIAVCGGDGTVSHAVQQLAHSDTVLGIIPQGTHNNFATALRLPQDLPSALRVLGDGEVQKVDLGKVGDRYFTESAGVGMFADSLALYGIGTNKNFALGLYSTMRVLLSFRSQRVRLTIDGKTHIERAVMCEVANTYRMAQGISVAPGAKITDGELDVVIIGDLQRNEILSYYRAFRAQLHLNLPKVTTVRAKTVHIEARHRMNLHCDDTVIAMTPATIEVQPNALKVLVDRL